ncbi:hypothetical protein NN561_010279 [Cricetulus griseus]
MFSKEALPIDVRCPDSGARLRRVSSDILTTPPYSDCCRGSRPVAEKIAKESTDVIVCTVTDTHAVSGLLESASSFTVEFKLCVYSKTEERLVALSAVADDTGELEVHVATEFWKAVE